MQVRKARPEDITEMTDLIRQAAAGLQKAGIDQWQKDCLNTDVLQEFL